MTENEIAKEAVDVAFHIHNDYGPGLMESVYEAIMAYELQKRGLRVNRQQAIPFPRIDSHGGWVSRRLNRREQGNSGD